MTTEGTPPFFTPPQLAKLANVSRATVARDVQRGRLDGTVRIGERYIVPATTGLKYVKQLKANPPRRGVPRS